MQYSQVTEIKEETNLLKALIPNCSKYSNRSIFVYILAVHISLMDVLKCLFISLFHLCF